MRPIPKPIYAPLSSVSGHGGRPSTADTLYRADSCLCSLSSVSLMFLSISWHLCILISKVFEDTLTNLRSNPSLAQPAHS